MDGRTAAHQWLVNRIDRRFCDSVRDVVSAMTVDLAVASASAVTVRALSDDGRWLFPVAVHHPDERIQEAMTGVMDDTAQQAGTGLWGEVCRGRRPVRWRISPGHVPSEASVEQAAFLRRFPIRAVLAVPVESGGRLLGGASLVRYVVDRTFTDDDEALLSDFAVRVALALGCLRTLGDLGTPSAEACSPWG